MRDALVIPSERCPIPSRAFGSPWQQAPWLDGPTSLMLWGWLSVSSAEAGITTPLFMKQLLFVSLVLLWHVVIWTNCSTFSLLPSDFRFSQSLFFFFGGVLKPCQNYPKGYGDNYVLFVLQILYSIPFKCIYIVLFHFGTGLEWNVTFCTTVNNLHFHR